MAKKIIPGSKVLSADVKTGSPLKVIGTATCVGFEESSAGIALLKANLTMTDLKNINRQRLTDVANDLRRGQSPVNKLKKLAAGNEQAKREMDALIKKYGA